MIMVSAESERKKNQAAYRKLRAQLEERYWGRFVVIAEGRLIADASTYQEAIEKAEKAASKTLQRLIFKVGEDYPKEVTVGGNAITRPK
jgi:mannose-1-phosphate guanylyltransferase